VKKERGALAILMAVKVCKIIAERKGVGGERRHKKGMGVYTREYQKITI